MANALARARCCCKSNCWWVSRRGTPCVTPSALGVLNHTVISCHALQSAVSTGMFGGGGGSARQSDTCTIVVYHLLLQGTVIRAKHGGGHG